MERYQRVEKPKPEQPINENEIRVTAQGLIRNYITYATSLFQDKHEKEIILKAMGQAISKAVAIAEIIKKRIPGLHQNISTSSTTITDAYEPIEEGLNPLEMKRQVSLIAITLSTIELNKNSPGYQAPTLKQANEENQQEQQTNPSTLSSADAGEGMEGSVEAEVEAEAEAEAEDVVEPVADTVTIKKTLDIKIGVKGGDEAEAGDTVAPDTKEAEAAGGAEVGVTAMDVEEWAAEDGPVTIKHSSTKNPHLQSIADGYCSIVCFFFKSHFLALCSAVIPSIPCLYQCKFCNSI
ncbi:UNVERIFIED_CONTAM: Ribonuclease P protein subunit p25-like protein [Sesamum latifolium]|uniref:Ribonuclease P protein subunit p25-like protein n=1 Tax=Sesamum latifolium TaxID=2727402 RepID=A0AAW2XXC1_9LAMI